VVVLGQLALTSAAVYAGSVCNSTMWAISVRAWDFRCTACVGSWMIGRSFQRQQTLADNPFDFFYWLFAGLAFFGLICLLQWFAYCNFRRRGSSSLRVVLQLLALFLFPASVGSVLGWVVPDSGLVADV